MSVHAQRRTTPPRSSHHHTHTGTAHHHPPPPRWLRALTPSFSPENAQRLRYCLHLLRLANAHIATKVRQLQQAIAQDQLARADAKAGRPLDIKRSSSTSSRLRRRGKHTPLAPAGTQFSATVTSIKKDIVWTLRKVVSAVSTYAGTALPEPARSQVRRYILRLPQRWVEAMASVSATERPVDPPSSPGMMADDSSDLESECESEEEEEEAAEEWEKDGLLGLQAQADAGARVLRLAQETVDMISNIIEIVGETLERMEWWLAPLLGRQESAGERAGAGEGEGREATRAGDMAGEGGKDSAEVSAFAGGQQLAQRLKAHRPKISCEDSDMPDAA